MTAMNEGDGTAPAIIDVRALTKGLGRQHGKLEKAARQWIATHSCSADLAIVRDYLTDAVRWHRTGRASLGHAKTALLHTAILSYARMFDPRASHHRSQLPIVGQLNEDQRAFHDTLINLRHEALAHFGKAGVSEPWYEDALYVVADQMNWQPMVASRRSQFDLRFCLAFQSHVQTLEPMVDGLVEKYRQNFQERFQSAWESDREFPKLLASARIEPERLGGWSGPLLAGSREGRLQVELPDALFRKP